MVSLSNEQILHKELNYSILKCLIGMVNDLACNMYSKSLIAMITEGLYTGKKLPLAAI